jgi:isopentenyl diphosphate isomerase/L-lactate dehydrogenase-like FMN-dependent dehydrogenase
LKVNCAKYIAQTTIFGVKLPAPLITAPIGVQGLVHPDAELATARATSRVGVPMIMSTASTRSLEDAAEANGTGHRWYQLYWPKDPEVTNSLLSRAKSNGYTALVVTLDTITIGWRPHDLDKSYLPFFHGTGIAMGTSDPVFMHKQGKEPYPPGPAGHIEFPYDIEAMDRRTIAGDPEAVERVKLGVSWIGEVNSGLYRTWDDLKLLREHWDGPIVLKGIQSVEDAEIAIDYVEGIVVSNHGGRQVDGAISSLSALDKICLSEKVRAAQESGKFTVFFDSGIRTGSDIIKAIALGAQAILRGYLPLLLNG